jgi:hypothetical protein
MVPGENGAAELIISGGGKEQRKEQVRHVMSSNQLSKNHPVTGMRGKAPHYPAKLYGAMIQKRAKSLIPNFPIGAARTPMTLGIVF